MRKEDLSIDITFNPCQFSLDSPFNGTGDISHNGTGDISLNLRCAGLLG